MAISVGKVLTKIFGSRNDRLLKRYRAIVEKINEWEPKVAAMTDDQLRARTQELRAGLTGKKLRPADVMPEAFAMIRESMDRHIGIREIFNPEQNFDPDKFDDEHLGLYDEVQQRIIASGESWQTVPIPHKLYAAVRKLYPESRPPFRARPFDVQLIGGLVLSEGRIAEMATGEGKTFVAPLAIRCCCTWSYAWSIASSSLSGSNFCSGLKISRMPMLRSIASRMIAKASGMTSADLTSPAAIP